MATVDEIDETIFKRFGDNENEEEEEGEEREPFVEPIEDTKNNRKTDFPRV